MHGFWWIFWLVVIVGLVWAVVRSRWNSGTPSARESRETPMEVLKRRYAEGNLSTEEYEKRKKRLERDR